MMHARTPIYRGRIVTVDLQDVALPDGRAMALEIVRHPGGAAVVAVDAQGRVCLLRQYRHVAGGWLWELPAGKLDGGEAPIHAARRELEEEAGVRAAQWISLGTELSSPGVFTEVIHLFLARGLEPVPRNTEVHELIEVHWVPFTEALARARSGEIRDAKTVIGLFRAEPRLA